jgi:hypothetical protein
MTSEEIDARKIQQSNELDEKSAVSNVWQKRESVPRVRHEIKTDGIKKCAQVQHKLRETGASN